MYDIGCPLCKKGVMQHQPSELRFCIDRLTLESLSVRDKRS